MGGSTFHTAASQQGELDLWLVHLLETLRCPYFSQSMVQNHPQFTKTENELLQLGLSSTVSNLHYTFPSRGQEEVHYSNNFEKWWWRWWRPLGYSRRGLMICSWCESTQVTHLLSHRQSVKHNRLRTKSCNVIGQRMAYNVSACVGQSHNQLMANFNVSAYVGVKYLWVVYMFYPWLRKCLLGSLVSSHHQKHVC